MKHTLRFEIKEIFLIKCGSIFSVGCTETKSKEKHGNYNNMIIHLE